LRMGCCSSGSQASAADAHATNGKAENGTSVEALKKPEQVEIPGNGTAAKGGPEKRAPDRGRAEPDQVPTIGTEARPAGPRPKRKAGTSPAAAGQQQPPPPEQPAPTRRKKNKNSLLELQKRSGEPESVREENEVWYPVRNSSNAGQSGRRDNTSAPSIQSTLNGIKEGLQKQAKSVDRVPPQPLAQRGSWSNGEDGIGADPPMLDAKVGEATKVKPQHLLALFSMGGVDPGVSGGLQGHARQEEEEEPFSVQEEVLCETVKDRQIDFKDVNMTFG